MELRWNGGNAISTETVRGSQYVTGLPKYDIYRSENSATTIIIDGKKYTFESSGAAIYGYELYRLSKIMGDEKEARSKLVTLLANEAKNNAIVAIAPGVIKNVEANPISGFKVQVRHSMADGTEVYSSYVHMKRYPLVQEGEYVGAGTVLGYEGTTGNSGGLHLHFEIGIYPDIGRGIYSLPYIYPFFTPFYLEAEDGSSYEMDDEHLSLIRTVYPVGQVVDSDLLSKFPPQADGELASITAHHRPERERATIRQVKVDGSGKIKTTNYVPSKSLVDDYKKLLTEEDEWLSTTYMDPYIMASPIYWGGPHVVTYKSYFNKYILDIAGQTGGYLIAGLLKDPTPHVFDNTKEKLGAGGITYSASAWKQLESALFKEVAKGGYGTRAGTVAAARFLAGMKYAVPYLGHEEAFSDMGMYARTGLDSTWGGRTTIAGREYKHNGLDSASFINWCLINGGVKEDGFDGTGTDSQFGTMMQTQEALANNLVRVGDILEARSYLTSGITGQKGWEFTHGGIIIGINGGTYYVAEQTQGSGKLVINTYTGAELAGALNVIYVDENYELYGSDGNLDKVTNEPWYNVDGKEVANF